MTTEKTYLVNEKRLRDLVAAELIVERDSRGSHDFFKFWEDLYNRAPLTIPEITKLIIDKDFQCITALSE